MKLKLDITPDLVAAMAAEVKAGEKAVTAAMREAGTGLKTSWRRQITGAGLTQDRANRARGLRDVDTDSVVRNIRREQLPEATSVAAPAAWGAYANHLVEFDWVRVGAWIASL